MFQERSPSEHNCCRLESLYLQQEAMPCNVPLQVGDETTLYPSSSPSSVAPKVHNTTAFPQVMKGLIWLQPSNLTQLLLHTKYHGHDGKRDKTQSLPS